MCDPDAYRLVSGEIILRNEWKVLGFSSAIVTQLSLAEVHGNLHLSLGKIEEYLDNLAKVKKKLIEVATYPLILLGFLLLIMLGLRNYLLPQLDSSNIATQIIGNLPQIFSRHGRVCFSRCPFSTNFL